MLPLIPIAAAVTSAAVLIRRRILKAEKQSNFSSLVRFIKDRKIPVSDNDRFNPDYMLADGKPLLFDTFLQPELLTSLLDYGANPNICSTTGVPAIIYALHSVHADDVLPILLKYGANPNAMDAEGKTAIFHTKVHKFLLMLRDAGADMNAVDCTGRTALFYTFIREPYVNFDRYFANFDRYFAELLIELGADVNIRDCEGKTAMFYATSDAEISLLSRMGADINARDNEGRTALFYSFVNHTTSALISKGANCHIKDNEGKSILFFINGEIDFPLVAELERFGIDLDVVDNNGNKFEYYCAFKEYKIKTRENKTLNKTRKDLYDAVNCDDIKEVQRLILEGVDVNIMDADVKEWNMIHLAVYRDNPEMIEILARAGADINFSITNTPIVKAIFDKRFGCFKKLLELGAKTPESTIWILNSSGTPEMKEFFKQYMSTKMNGGMY